MDNAESVYVQLGENESGEVYVVEMISDELKTKLSSRNIEIRTKTNAKYSVSYRVLSYVITAEDLTSEEVVNQYSIKIKALFTLNDEKGRMVSENEILGSSLYDDDAEKGKEDAVTDLISKYLTEIENNW